MGMEYISLLSILGAIVLLIVLCYKGIPAFFVAPGCALLVLIVSGMDIKEGMTKTYMSGFSRFAQNYFLIFFMGAIFGQVMGDSGAARSIGLKIARIAKKFPKHTNFLAVLGLPIISTILTMGGVSVFVCMFTVIAIARELLEELDIPWHLYMCQCMGTGSYTLTMMPGSPSVTNLIPMNFFGTQATAAPVIGILSSLLMFAIGTAYIYYVVHRSMVVKGERFMPTGSEIVKVSMTPPDVPEMKLWFCLLPSALLLVVLNGLKMHAAFALLCAVVLGTFMFRKNLTNIVKTWEAGANNAIRSTMTICMVVAFGSVVAASPGYQVVLGALDKIPGPPIVQLIIAVNLCAGVTGSSSGGLTIALNSLSERFIATGINPEVLHRISSISCGGLDSLPHNGTVINSLVTARLSHSQGYKHQFWLNTAFPIVVVIFAAFLASLGLV